NNPDLFAEYMTMLPAIFLLVIAKWFKTLERCGHLKVLPHDVPLWQAIVFSWMIALFVYSLMIPTTLLLAQQGLAVGQMQITQEVVTLLVIVPFMIFIFKQPFKLDYLWAASCLCGCVYFVFRTS